MANEQSSTADVAQAIVKVKQEVEKLREMAGHLPCVDRNCKRLLASVAMLELDVVDVWNLVEAPKD